MIEISILFGFPLDKIDAISSFQRNEISESYGTKMIVK